MIAIDPGTTQSAFVAMRDPIDAAIVSNRKFCTYLRYEIPWSEVVIEKVESYGQAVGKDIFRTVWWSGRLSEAAISNGARVYEIGRREVKLHLCNSARAKDANVRQALIDRYGGEGGKQAAVGTKKNPGPLYGIKSHMWAALAVGVTFMDATKKQREGWRVE